MAPEKKSRALLGMRIVFGLNVLLMAAGIRLAGQVAQWERMRASRFPHSPDAFYNQPATFWHWCFFNWASFAAFLCLVALNLTLRDRIESASPTLKLYIFLNFIPFIFLVSANFALGLW